MFHLFRRLSLIALTVAALAVMAHLVAAQTQRDIFADTWAATDSLGRTLPAPAVTGPPRSNKTIALFYYLWNGSHTTGLYDISQIIAQDPDAIHEYNNPLWGPPTHWHFWGEPLFGYYRMQDPWVIRRHAQMLTDAGVNVIFFDVTNAQTYKPVYDLVLNTYAQMRLAGQDTPQIGFLTWSGSGGTVQKLYDDLYLPGRHSDLWFRWNGKPVILAKSEELTPAQLNFFTVRRSWAWDPGEDRWPWLEEDPQQGGWSGSPTNLEEVSVATASHPTAGAEGKGKSFHLTSQPPDSDRDTALGINFANQWRRALELDPALVLVTQWNEWTAQRYQYTGPGGTYAKRPLYTNDPWFVDVFDDEFNRDIEPMKGGHGDNYYYQLIDHARRFKGARSVAAVSPPATINLQDFNSWSGVGPDFLDDVADISHRSHIGFGNRVYSDTTGRNDIRRALVARDDANVYFYVETETALSSKSIANEWWMNCFLRDETAATPDWEGYHFRLSNANPAGTNLTLSRCTGGWNWTPLAEVTTYRAGNRMAVAIPRVLLDLSASSTHANLSFKWTDNQQAPTSDAWLLHGDAAPNARFRYVFSAPGSHTAVPLSGRSYRLVHRSSLKFATPNGTSLSIGTPLHLTADTQNAAQKWTLMDAGAGRWAFFSTRAALTNGAASPLVVEPPGGAPSNGLALHLGTWTQANHQLWTLSATGDGWFRLINSATGMALAVGADGALTQSTAAAAPDQHWSLEPVAPLESGERYRFTNRQSGLVANLEGHGMNPGNPATQSSNTAGINQQWIAYPLAPDRVQLSGVESRRPLEPAGFSTANGAAVVQGDWSSNIFQQWDIRMVAPGYFQWINAGSGMAAGVLGGSSVAGTALAQRPASSASTDSQWRVSTNADSQPLEIDPAGAIPSSYTRVFSTEWNTAGNIESWTTSDFNLAPSTPTGGELMGTVSSADPQLNLSGLSLVTSKNTIIEFRLKKQSTDNSRIDLFWGDANGGISGARAVTIGTSSIPVDGALHTYRITFSGQITGAINRFRFDVASDGAGNGKTVAVDYFRVYSELPASSLSWDPGMTGTGTAGGAGTWNASSSSWWSGNSQARWPSTSSGQDIATFAGAGNTVNIASSGVTASTLIFNSAGYTLAGGPLTLDGSRAILRSTGVTTNIESRLAGSATVFLEGAGGGLVLRGINTTLTGPVSMAVQNLGFTQNTALGSGSFTAGAGGGVSMHALNGDRTIPNDVNFNGNQLIIDSANMGTGLLVGNLTINGNFALNGVSPADFVLRKNLTINGVVSGGNNNRGLTLASDPGTLTLTGDNAFRDDITWNVGAVVAADSDAALGDVANTLNFNSGSGSLKLLASFNSARPIVIDNNSTGNQGTSTTTGQIDTNGFETTWTGTISAPPSSSPALAQQTLGATLGGGLTKNGLGTLTLAPVAGPNTYTGPTTVNAGVLAVNGIAIADTGKLDIVGGIVSIPAAINEVVGTLFYNGVQQPAGVYGSNTSGAVNQNNTYFSGAGTLTVISGPAGVNNFASWLAANPPATGFTTDSDNDVLANGVENVLGTNPNASSVGLMQVSATANSVTFKHTLNPTIASDVNYSYEWSSDLIEWRSSGVANTAGTIGTIVPSAPVSGEVSVTTTQTGTPSRRLFTRIKATNP